MKNNSGIPFIITLSYLLAFLGIRTSVLIAGSANSEFAQVAMEGGLPDLKFYIGRNIILFGYHIHHFYIGIFLICLSAWMSLVGSSFISRKKLAMIYGIGLGLFVDEIGLLLTWGHYYSSLTYIISIFVFSVFINIVFFHQFWESLKTHLFSKRRHNTVEEFLLKNKIIMRGIDFFSITTARSTRLNLLFSGLLYLIITALIIRHPHFLKYFIAGTFIVHGLSFFPKALYTAKGIDSEGL